MSLLIVLNFSHRTKNVLVNVLASRNKFDSSVKGHCTCLLVNHQICACDGKRQHFHLMPEAVTVSPRCSPGITEQLLIWGWTKQNMKKAIRHNNKSQYTMINNINRLTDARTQGHRETAAKIDRQTEWFHIIQKYPIRLVMYLWRVEWSLLSSGAGWHLYILIGTPPE